MSSPITTEAASAVADAEQALAPAPISVSKQELRETRARLDVVRYDTCSLADAEALLARAQKVLRQDLAKLDDAIRYRPDYAGDRATRSEIEALTVVRQSTRYLRYLRVLRNRRRDGVSMAAYLGKG